MRLHLLLLLALLAGCAGAGPNEKVRAMNDTDGPAMMTIVLIDTASGQVDFDHGFQVVPAGQALTVDADLRDGREYRVNVTASFGEQETRSGEQRLNVPGGAHVEAHLARTGALTIRVLAVD